MNIVSRRGSVTGRLLSAAAAFAFLSAQPIPLGAESSPAVAPALFAGLQWRSIGPFRGGRSVAAAGVAGDGRTFYFGAVGGGVWKTENAGRTWFPVMDSQPVASIGALAVAPSDPKTVYAGSGEADMRSDIIAGNGMYRSTDAGATWTHIGLDDSRQIGRILVDPHDPKTLLVAALGHGYGPNETRGVYRSTDGGATWMRTLFHDRDTGAIDLAADPAMHVVFASLWQTRRPPWNTYPPSNGPGSGLYRSADGGLTWAPVRGTGLPVEGLGKIGLAVAPSNPKRVYAILDAKAGGLYRSDDGGATWRLADADKRIWQRGWYFCHVAVDPTDPDSVYISSTSVYHSSDGGAHFTAVKGSPDGDDFHQLWIDPTDHDHMVLASDQGTSVSVDDGQTWSSWFNQPTGQFYHVATDNAFPYRIYGSQQDSGAAMIVSRSDHAGIEERDWRPISAGGESGTIAPDPADSNVIYGGEVDREDLRTNQTRSLSPTLGRPGVWRSEWTLPLAFGPDHALYAAHQIVFRSRDGGATWQAISGDLTRHSAGTPANLDPVTAADAETPEPRGVVYALAPSPLRADVLWAGTDDGLVKLTADGGRTWRDVTPAGVTPWSHIDAIEASHFDPDTAYVAVDRHRLDDEAPYLFATHDRGRTWRSIAAGIPDGSFANGIREDPVRRGLLYAATETGVFVSFDDGASWQSLRLNMPVVSVRDISVHGDDLAIATHGRAFWVLDDVEPLRELAANPGDGLRLFAPDAAIRTRAGNDEAEATPPETPLGANPPNGAPIDYVLPAGASGPVALTVLDARGAIVRAWSSDRPSEPVKPEAVDFPAYWIVTPTVPATGPGMHRFVWDFHAARADGPLAPPGKYTVRLETGGIALTRPLALLRDPRIAASDADLVAQSTLAGAIDALALRVTAAGKKELAEALGELAYAVESADAAPTHAERAAFATLRAQALRAGVR